MSLPRAVVALLALLPLGCSLHAGPVRNLTEDTGPSVSDDSSMVDHEQEESYHDDVRDYTYAYVDADGELLDFEGGLEEIAERHGISNWDATDATYIAIGAGLAEAQVSASQLDDFKRTLGRADASKMNQIQQGFDRGH